jgi:hypothetical protein
MNEEGLRHIRNIFGVMVIMFSIALAVAVFKTWYGLWGIW